MSEHDSAPLTKADLQAALDELFERFVQHTQAAIRKAEVLHAPEFETDLGIDPFTGLRLTRLEDALKDLRARLIKLEQRRNSSPRTSLRIPGV